jgi:hypothetical protein
MHESNTLRKLRNGPAEPNKQKRARHDGSRHGEPVAVSRHKDRGIKDTLEFVRLDQVEPELPRLALDCRNQLCPSSASNVGDFLERIPEGIFNDHADFAPADLGVSFDNR